MVVRLDFDTSALRSFTSHIEQVPLRGRAAVIVSMNQVGDGLVRELVQLIGDTTGLSNEQVRQMLQVRRASVGDLEYYVSIRDVAMQEQMSRGLERRQFRTGRGGEEQTFRAGQLVKVVTRKDELVCDICEAIAAHGPYTIEEAQSNVHHGGPIGTNNCRCILMPYVSRRQMEVQMTGPGSRMRETVRSNIRDLAERLGREMRGSFRITTR